MPPETAAKALKITSHRVFESFEGQHSCLEVLHQDLFDSDREVVLSSLQALSAVGQQGSLKHVAKLLTHRDGKIQLQAIETIGRIGHPLAVKILFDLFKIAKAETVRVVILEALARIVPQDPDLLRLVEEFAASHALRIETRARATQLLLSVKNSANLENILSGAKEEIVSAVFAHALEHEEAVDAVVQYGLSAYHRLSTDNRLRLVEMACTCTVPGAQKIVLEGVKDVAVQVREKVYSLLGERLGSAVCVNEMIGHLAEHVDVSPSLEEQVIQALERLEQKMASQVILDQDIRSRLYANIQELFQTLSATDRRISSEDHELGWLIARSREYVEFYADEDLRTSIVNFIRGTANYTEEDLLAALRKSAVKVEVRHFEGYKCLAEIIKHRKRSGASLITRELAIAKLGKRPLFHKLIRNLYVSRLFDTSGLKIDAVQLFEGIFTWANKAKLYRLAEAALFALAKVDMEKTTRHCLDALTPPVDSKILAIAAIRLLKDLEWSVAEPAIVGLLGSLDDVFVLLNLFDALSALNISLGGALVEAIVRVFRSSTEREVVQRIAEFLGTLPSFSVVDSLLAHYARMQPWRQKLVFMVIQRKILERKVSNREGLTEFLYTVLRSEDKAQHGEAALLLWQLGDDYATKVLEGLFKDQDSEILKPVISGFKGLLDGEILMQLKPLFIRGNAEVQELLRETVLSVEEEKTRQEAVQLMFKLRGAAADAEEDSGQGEDVQVDFFEEKKAYRFEREHIQQLAILFTDIQGYTKKAQVLSSMQLSLLIQEYEGILLPTMSDHRGELIKRMGDGHLFVFADPLHAVLAGIRLQKAMKRFNSYREESSRVVVRVGAHWGKVVRKEGDVLGNHVNIAARLESSANGGSVLISEALHMQLGSHVHSREIGLISVKGISEQIQVYEPYEIAVDLPSGLDPLKGGRAKASESEGSGQPAEAVPAQTRAANGNGGNGGSGRCFTMDEATVKYLADTFSRINSLCLQAEKRQIEIVSVRRELTSRWKRLRSALQKTGAGG